MDTHVTTAELGRIMADLGMSTADAADYVGLVEGNLAAAAISDAIAVPPPADVGQRLWHHPAAEDNPHGAWYVRTDIQGNNVGRLAGRRIAVKDNVLLAGVPLMNGTSVLEGYVPDRDAEIVTRMLAEGGQIVGKTVCEAYCFSGGSHTSATGPVRNPHDPDRSAGGSSSGSGVVVATGEVDMAIGCDQGGSIRMPASFCGVVGMKPTHSLVPYTGVLGMNPNIDHTGPMTATVADNALLLEVLAGPDGVDSRQYSTDAPPSYTAALGDGDLHGVRIGIVPEGFAMPGAEDDVNAAVRDAAAGLGKLGAQVCEVSIPMHTQAGAVTFGTLQATVSAMFDFDGCTLERPDIVPPEFVKRQRGWREHADELPANVKLMLISNTLLRERSGYYYLARARQLMPVVRAAYDAALARVDVLLMPTTPMKATPLPPADASPQLVTQLAFGPLANTGVFNNTHHPALSLPCGRAAGLPVGMMLVGRHFEESLLYRVAHAAEGMFKHGGER